MRVHMLPEAELEYTSLPGKERFAMQSAFDKLIALGDRLGYPHSSAVQGSRATLRELRPRSGNCPWRAFYRRIGDQMVIASIGPEAHANPSGFRKAVRGAVERLERIEGEATENGKSNWN